MNYDNYRQECMQKGIEFQDFICEQLHFQGIVLQNMQSKVYQYKKENLLGLEIKFDDVMNKTQRIYIETAEKAQPRSGDYVEAGIYRKDKSWMFGIGNYTVFYIFDKKGLQRLDKANPAWLYRPVPSDTSKGFCIPINKAERLAMKVIHFATT